MTYVDGFLTVNFEFIVSIIGQTHGNFGTNVTFIVHLDKHMGLSPNGELWFALNTATTSTLKTNTLTRGPQPARERDLAS